MSTQETRRRSLRYAVYLLYWYKSTSTDAGGAARIWEHATFFCQFFFHLGGRSFTGTKVQVLTQEALLGSGSSPHFFVNFFFHLGGRSCTGTKVQVLTQVVVLPQDEDRTFDKRNRTWGRSSWITSTSTAFASTWTAWVFLRAGGACTLRRSR